MLFVVALPLLGSLFFSCRPPSLKKRKTTVFFVSSPLPVSLKKQEEDLNQPSSYPFFVWYLFYVKTTKGPTRRLLFKKYQEDLNKEISEACSVLCAFLLEGRDTKSFFPCAAKGVSLLFSG